MRTPRDLGGSTLGQRLRRLGDEQARPSGSHVGELAATGRTARDRLALTAAVSL